MVAPLLFSVLGVVTLWLGAEWLVFGAATLARRLGMSPLAIGLTIVAFGTSMPELVVSVRGALGGNGDVAVGNVIGSNIANIALILGLAAWIRPVAVEARVVRVEIPLLLVVTGVAFVLLRGGLGRGEGAALLVGLAAYTFWQWRESPKPELDDVPAPGGRPTALLLCAIVAGLIALVAGAKWLVDGAIAIAREWQVSEAVIALTIVAVGTSLPELVTSAVAAKRGESDIAIGNVVGSNVFNLLGVLGASSACAPLATTGIAPLDLGAFLLTPVLLLPVAKSGKRISRREGALGVAAWIAWVAWTASR